MFVWVPLAVLTSSFTNRDARYALVMPLEIIVSFSENSGRISQNVRFSIAVLCLGLMAVLRHKCNGN